MSLPATPQLPDSEQIRSFKEFLSQYNKLSETCFTDCVWEFTTRKVSRGEDTCAMNCAEKYLKMNQRVSTRFQEFQMLQSENAMAQMAKATAEKK